MSAKRLRKKRALKAHYCAGKRWLQNLRPRQTQIPRSTTQARRIWRSVPRLVTRTQKRFLRSKRSRRARKRAQKRPRNSRGKRGLSRCGSKATLFSLGTRRTSRPFKLVEAKRNLAA